MKKLYTLILLLALFTCAAQAQVVLVSENFSSSSQTNVAAVTNGSWFVYSGVYMTTQTSGSATSVVQANITKPISALDADIRVKWTGVRQSNNGQSSGFDSNVFLCYKIGNGAVQKVPVDTRITLGTAVANEVVIPLSSNYSNVQIYFETTAIKNYSYYIDDLEVASLPNMFKWSTRPAGENPLVASAPKSAAPYQLNEVPMYWSMTKGNGVVLESSVVGNTEFPRSSQSFSITQTGASKTEGTHVKIQFDAMMQDVTFNIFDVDRTTTTNQFIDSLVVTGVDKAGNVVRATKSFVKNAANAQFNANNSSFKGLAAVDNSSEGGNITVAFGEEVKEINVSYYNLGIDKGRQGISFGNFNGYQSATPLPVELITFKGAVQYGNVKLSWATAMELNNDRFEVERSQDGKTFSKIGEVRGHGNSSVRLDYSFTDTAPAAGDNYYRLRQVDFDGTEDFSKVVALKVDAKQAQMVGGAIAKVYPTVASSEVTVSLALDKIGRAHV